MSASSPVRVMIVDDHPIVRSGLSDLLEDSGKFAVVAQAADGEEALRLAQEAEPQVVIMDVFLPGKDGIETCRELTARLPETRVMMLTAATQQDAVIDAIAAGATGYVEKFALPEALLSALSDVAEGRLSVPEEAVKQVFAMLKGRRQLDSSSPADRLTAIERQTLTLFARGTPYAEIAKQRGNSVVTVRNTLYRVQDKLGIETKQELVIWAVRNGLLDDVVVGIDEQRFP